MFRRRRKSEKALAPAPVIVPAQVVSAVKPAIPAHLLGEHSHRDQSEAAFWALFTVHADGTAAVAMTKSTGHAAVDALALDAARRWRFAPATLDGIPVASYLRLKVEFGPALPPGRRLTRKETRL